MVIEYKFAARNLAEKTNDAQRTDTNVYRMLIEPLHESMLKIEPFH